MKKILVAALLTCSLNVIAGPCTVNDAWHGIDKTKHFAVGVAVGSAGTLVFKNPDYGFLVGVGVGAVKEVADRFSYTHTCSLQDFAVTAMGAGVGSYGTAFIITPKFIGFAKTL